MSPKYHFLISLVAAYFLSIQTSSISYPSLIPVAHGTLLDITLGSLAGVLIDVDHIAYAFARNRHLAWVYLSTLRLRSFYRLMRSPVTPFHYLLLHGFFILLACLAVSFLLPTGQSVIYFCLGIHYICDIGYQIFVHSY